LLPPLPPPSFFHPVSTMRACLYSTLPHLLFAELRRRVASARRGSFPPFLHSTISSAPLFDPSPFETLPSPALGRRTTRNLAVPFPPQDSLFLFTRSRYPPSTDRQTPRFLASPLFFLFLSIIFPMARFPPFSPSQMWGFNLDSYGRTFWAKLQGARFFLPFSGLPPFPF